MSSLTRIVILLILVLTASAPPKAPAAPTSAAPSWMEQVRHEAEAEGYRLATRADIKALVASKTPHVLLDVRADYEFQAGHIPGAINMEFDLGDRDNLSPAKKTRFQDVLGPDKSRPIIIYCRSFRCLRSGIAARWAARLGYTNVARYPDGWMDWIAIEKTGRNPQAVAKRLSSGDLFPACSLTILDGPQDAAYLSLLPGTKAFALDDVPATFVLVEFYKELCMGCLSEIPAYNEFHRLAQADERLHDEFRMFGIGVRESKSAVATFRKSKQVVFPLFSDDRGDLFDCLGNPPLPTAYLLRRLPDGRREIIMVQSGSMTSPQALLRKIKSAIAQATRR